MEDDTCKDLLLKRRVTSVTLNPFNKILAFNLPRCVPSTLITDANPPETAKRVRQGEAHTLPCWLPR
jgi:hypothetical protein